MFDKHAIETFKWTNNPKWSLPFLDLNVAVATWIIGGVPYNEIINLNVTNQCKGWIYEAS